MKFISFVFLLIVFISCDNNPGKIKSTLTEESTVSDKIKYTASSINLDGKFDELFWGNSDWRPINHVWLGAPVDSSDFYGQFKLVWTDSFLYVAAQVHDDTLMDNHKDGLDNYWNDDCLEIFVDQDGSKGNHQYNHNAFAYHIALDGKVVDIGTDSVPHYYNHHLKSHRLQNGLLSNWEVAIRLFEDTYLDSLEEANSPTNLKNNQNLGFAIAYCDNDRSETRENFIGSIFVAGDKKDQGWIDAGIFQQFKLD